MRARSDEEIKADVKWAMGKATIIGAPIVGLMRPRLVGLQGYVLVGSVATMPIGAVAALLIASDVTMGLAVVFGSLLGGGLAGLMFYAKSGQTTP